MVQRVGPESAAVITNPLKERDLMEMVLVIGLCIVAVAIIERQHASMRRMVRLRVDRDDRRIR